VLAEVGRDLAGAGTAAGTTQQQAIVVRLGTAADQFASSPRRGDVVGLLAA
jgi:hypothetical protein